MNRMEECIYYNHLFDLYGNLLTQKEKEIYTLFYEEDLSLQEIAEIRCISKSAVGKTIKTINKKLDNLELKLNFLKKTEKIQTFLKNIPEKEIRKKLEEILEKK